MLYIWMSHVTYIWMSHFIHMNEPRHTYNVSPTASMSHITHMNESSHTYEWVTSHIHSPRLQFFDQHHQPSISFSLCLCRNQNCVVLQCVTVCLQCVAVCWVRCSASINIISPRYLSACASVEFNIALCCSVLQGVYRGMQCVAVPPSTTSAFDVFQPVPL